VNLVGDAVPLLDEDGRPRGALAVLSNITELKRAETRLREAQKMESLGLLAGGVAHDFNNLLTVINGYSDIVFRGLAEGDTLRPQVDQIRIAGARAADLTQQLLGFSRKQTIRPRQLDLNQVVVESENMLRRLLGEDIELETRLSPELGRVMADLGQIHQILMNLVVNARDAMPNGGRLILGTANVEIYSDYVKEHSDATAGSFVLLAVTDNGTGIDEEAGKHIFEPFYTTKGPARGSGLGLATVHGIVKQSQGWISVETAMGKGTTFRIYLPRIGACAETQVEAEPRRPNARRSETVLVVEDQDEVRGLAIRVLRTYGYSVLEAADGATALELVKSHAGPIHLLLTDVVLPGMNGRELAESVRTLLPGTKVLYTSGYTRDVIAHRGVLGSDVAYIAKPYSPAGLAAKVAEALAS
jgi:signal transduction histidine kinase/CheY-like chemotaxis protein